MTLYRMLRAQYFQNGMTVAELKKMIRDWPETDEYGEPCEVWLCDGNDLGNQEREMKTLAKYTIFGFIGAALGAAGYTPFGNWQWWAWFLPMLAAVHMRDWAMSA